jgi:hypothetical protein|tara:strand:+ start:52 stop:339 length:288 start_codon:yes stop_codon:yes gene_type:complete
MIDIMNTFIAILLSVVALTPIFLLVILLNKSKGPSVQGQGIDPSVIKRLEDMDTTIATDTNVALETVSAKLEDLDTRLIEVEEQRTTIEGFKSKK